MRWIKLFRDVRTEGGRALLMLVAVAFAIFAVAAMLSAFGIVTREVRVNYVNTNPASATIDVDTVTSAMLEKARAFPGVADAEARAVVEARVKVRGEWMRMLLFVVDDFAAMRLNLFTRLSGAWPPPKGTMLVERKAIGVLGAGEGGTLTVQTQHGATTEVPVSGTVYDTTLAPAWQEQTGYGYITRETLAAFGEPAILDELRILVGGNPTMAEIDKRALALADALKADGAAVHSVKVPPPGQHPHQNQIASGLMMFLSFAVLTLVLAAILVAAVLAAALARQAREIGMMKAVGAQSGQIAVMYIGLLLTLGAAALVLGVPAGVLAGGRLSELMADTMNFTITDHAVPAWVYAILIGAGVLLPLLAALPAIVRASRTTVREAIGSTGVSSTFGASRFDRAIASFTGLALPYRLAARNIFRRRGRLLLALAMLAAGGGLFVTAFSVRDGWRALASTILTDRHYEVEFRFADSVAADRIAAALKPVAGVAGFELWGYEQTAFASPGRIDLMRTYPDGGHGSFAINALSPATRMVSFPMLEGRWLREGDTDAVVLTQQNRNQLAGLKLGDRVTLSVGGKPSAWTLVGVAREIGGGGAYVAKDRYDVLAGTGGGGRVLRVAFAAGDDPVERTTAIEKALADSGLTVERIAPLTMLYVALVGHVEVPVRMLIAAAVLLGLIGELGLASMMAVNVIERTREFGIMKATGAIPSVVVRIVVAEGMAIAGLSWFLSFAVALPLIRIIGSIATMMFGTSLPFTVSWPAAGIWALVIAAIAFAASAAPAARASRLIVREALAYT